LLIVHQSKYTGKVATFPAAERAQTLFFRVQPAEIRRFRLSPFFPGSIGGPLELVDIITICLETGILHHCYFYFLYTILGAKTLEKMADHDHYTVPQQA